ncbi:SAF domain-containing protein [Phytoactinopolyspora halotolerans]|uniref:Flagellar biosynthesis protein FlgA n=1 Tax=Phytoactinopolyspora halotolerans TaxID=1981512 RepID=A0A6L9SBP5_9ACTN|nr:SAF domain-containing protein [Phytoactinopolyspora halotolerans]NEE02775.1 flagellar biosynthesis protein FlgA [Phytoactinopolyspora halotolerans]
MAITTPHVADEAADRQRAREQRGIRRTAAVAQADRLPAPPRQRRPALAALAVLLIVGGATVAALLAIRADERVGVLIMEQPIAPGQQITEAHLGTTQVASEGTRLIPASQLDQVVGSYTTVRIEQGQLLDTSMIGGSGMLTDGHVAVGASLAAGRYPASGLMAGDVVNLVGVSSDGSGEVIAEEVRVSSTTGSEGDVVSGGGIMATFIIPSADAATVAARAFNESLAVVLVERGGSLSDETEE